MCFTKWLANMNGKLNYNWLRGMFVKLYNKLDCDLKEPMELDTLLHLWTYALADAPLQVQQPGLPLMFYPKSYQWESEQVSHVLISSVLRLKSSCPYALVSCPIFEYLFSVRNRNRAHVYFVPIQIMWSWGWLVVTSKVLVCVFVIFEFRWSLEVMAGLCHPENTWHLQGCLS